MVSPIRDGVSHAGVSDIWPRETFFGGQKGGTLHDIFTIEVQNVIFSCRGRSDRLFDHRQQAWNFMNIPVHIDLDLTVLRTNFMGKREPTAHQRVQHCYE